MEGKRVELCGLEIDDQPIEFWVNKIVFETPKLPFVLVTPNVDHLCRLSKDKDFFIVYKKSDYILCDSRILQKVSVILKGDRIVNVVPGSDLTKTIFELLKNSEKKIAVVGPSHNESLALKSIYDLKNLISFSPSMGFIRNPIEVQILVDELLEIDSEIIFLAVGSPQQEILAQEIKKRHLASGKNFAPAILCIGASIDFLTGKVKRAPKFYQLAHLEWLYRAISEPRRLIPRYSKNFIWLIGFIIKSLTKSSN